MGWVALGIATLAVLVILTWLFVRRPIKRIESIDPCRKDADAKEKDLMNFRAFMTAALEKNPELCEKLAEEFEVPQSTVRRWASGPANPPPEFKELIRQFVSKNQIG